MGSVDYSGASLARLAADDHYSNVSGKYFQVNDGKLNERRSAKMSYDKKYSTRLWLDSEKLAAIQPHEQILLSK